MEVFGWAIKKSERMGRPRFVIIGGPLVARGIPRDKLMHRQDSRDYIWVVLFTWLLGIWLSLL